MSDLQDMLRVQARLHRKQGANALGDLFQSAAMEIEILTERLENPQGLQELICVEQMKEISLPEIHRANQKLHEQLAKANADYKALFSAFESCQDELKKANERVEGLESGIKQTIPIVNTLYALARNQLWIAYVWNDHNFPLNPEKYAKEAAESIGITNVDEANKLVEAFKQLRKEQE